MSCRCLCAVVTALALTACGGEKQVDKRRGRSGSGGEASSVQLDENARNVLDELFALETKKDVTCWTSFRQLDWFIAEKSYSEFATLAKITAVKRLVRAAWANASQAAKGDTITGADFDAAVKLPQVNVEQDQKAKLQSFANDIGLQNFTDYQKTAEHWRVVLAVMMDEIYRGGGAALKPLDADALTKLADAATTLSLMLLKESGAQAEQAKSQQIEGEQVQAAYKKIADEHGLKNAPRQDQPLAVDDVKARLQPLTRSLIEGKVKALQSFNKTSEEMTADLNKVTRMPLTPEATAILLRDLQSFTHFVAAGFEPMQADNYLSDGSFAATKMARLAYLDDAHVQNVVIQLFPHHMMPNGDIVVAFAPNPGPIITTLKRAPFEIKMLDHEMNGVRDSAIHWIAMRNVWNEKAFAMDPFAAEYLSEVNSMLMTMFIRRAEMIAKEMGKTEIDAKVVARIRDGQYVQVPPQSPPSAQWTAERQAQKTKLLAAYPAKLYADATARSGLPTRFSGGVPLTGVDSHGTDGHGVEGHGQDGKKGGKKVEGHGVEGHGVDGKKGQKVEGHGVEGHGVEGKKGQKVEGHGVEGHGVEGKKGQKVEGHGVEGHGVEGKKGEKVEGHGVEGKKGEKVEGHGVEGHGVEGKKGEKVEGHGVEGHGVEGHGAEAKKGVAGHGVEGHGVQGHGQAVQGHFDIQQLMGGGIALGDVNNDTYTDVFLAGENLAKLYLNKGKGGAGTFTDASAAWGVPKGMNDSHGTLFFDMEGDGDLDLLILRSVNPSVILRQDKGKFTDVAKEVKFTPHRGAHVASIFDYDEDGDLDIYIGYYGNHLRNTGQEVERALPSLDGRNGSPNQLWRREADGSYVEVGEQAGVADSGWALATGTFDHDMDGHLDIHIANDFGADVMLRNRGDGTFEEITGATDTGDRGSGMNVEFGDINRDGRWDIYVTNIDMFSKRIKVIFPRDESTITIDESLTRAFQYLNGNKLYVSVTDAKSEHPYRAEELVRFEPGDRGWGWDAGFFDYENDGDDDIYITNGWVEGSYAGNQKNQMFVNDDGFFFLGPVDSPEAFPGNTRSAAYGDFDHDGDVDIVANNFQQPSKYLVNTQAAKNRWIELRLRGKGQNTQAIGALITIETPAGKILRQVSCGRGYISQADPLIHAGLKDAQAADVTIRWPDGTVQKLAGLASNQIHDVQQK